MNMNISEFAQQITKDTDPKDVVALFGKIDHFDSAALVLIYEAAGGNINLLIDKTTRAVKADDAGATAYRDFLREKLHTETETEEARETFHAAVHIRILNLCGDQGQEILLKILAQRDSTEKARIKAEALVAQWETEKCE